MLTADGTIRWMGEAVGKFTAGENVLRPRVRILADEQLTGAPMRWQYEEQNRIGDHICYISDLSKIRRHFPNWKIEFDIEKNLQDIANQYLSAACQSVSEPIVSMATSSSTPSGLRTVRRTDHPSLARAGTI